MGKNIVICCDGTNNEFGEENSNVVKLFNVLVKDTFSTTMPSSQSASFNRSTQVAFYDPGVGTFGASVPFPITRKVTKLLGLAVGWGLTKLIEDSYLYLMERYQDGDNVFIFGFSRGAFAARALAGMLHKVGLLQRGRENLVPYATKMWKQGKADISAKFMETYGRKCPIHFLGVWDTVKSVGLPLNPDVLPFSQTNPSVASVRHAVSVDEHRCYFAAYLWDPAKNYVRDAPGQNIKEVWFPGAHADVGGGYIEDQSGLAKITLKWMVDEAVSCGLVIDHGRFSAICPATSSNGVSSPDANASMHDELKRIASRYRAYRHNARK